MIYHFIVERAFTLIWNMAAIILFITTLFQGSLTTFLFFSSIILAWQNPSLTKPNYLQIPYWHQIAKCYWKKNKIMPTGLIFKSTQILNYNFPTRFAFSTLCKYYFTPLSSNLQCLSLSVTPSSLPYP